MEIFHKLLKSSRGPPKHTTLSWPQKAPITSLACYLRHRSHRPRTLLAASLWGHSLWPAGTRLARPGRSGWSVTVWLPLWGEIWVLFSWLRRRHSRSRTSGLESWPVLLSVSLGFSFLLRKMGSWYQRPERAWRALNESIS